MTDGGRVVVVTGGGGGIGAAVAEELGRQGTFVVTMDPLVTLDGTATLPPPEETTAGRIVAAGGGASASSASVTDGAAVKALFEEIVAEHGRLDGVINVAGITRPTSFTTGSEEDWRGVLAVHLDGYLNVLRAALPIMATVGRGRILGVTSGSGWRPADTGAYGCAKRAVAALTWQLGPETPGDVVVNAMSPIAVTRMVTAALARTGGSGGPSGGPGSSATGGLSLGSMPQPEDIAPFGAHLVSEDLSWCRGEVLFAGGSEVAVLDRPRLLEVVRTDQVASLAGVLEAVTAGALVPAEAQQASTGGSNPRFATGFDGAVAGVPSPAVRSCVVVTDRAEARTAIIEALGVRGVTCTAVDAAAVPAGFGPAADALATAVEGGGPVDGVVVAVSGRQPTGTSAGGWESVLAEHTGIVEQIHTDAAWARATADLAAGTARPVRLVTLVDAVTAGGRTRAQAAAQLSRAARPATGDLVTAFAVATDGGGSIGLGSIGEIVAHLLCSPDAVGLSGAELESGPGWFGLRSHPRPGASVTLGGSAIPGWLDGVLQRIVGGRHEEAR